MTWLGASRAPGADHDGRMEAAGRACVIMVLCSSVVVVSGCGTAATPRDPVATAVGTPAGESATVTIGAAGGSVSSVDGVLTVVLPPGALTSDVELSVTPISNEAPGGVGRAYRIAPEGLTLAQPADVIFSWTEGDLVGTAPEALAIGSQSATRHWEVLRDTTRDDGGRTIRGQTTHFSDWSRLAQLQLRPGIATVQTGESLALTLVWCAAIDVEAELVALMSACAPLDDGDATFALEEWSVNGVSGGGGAAGTVERVGETTGRYTAPSTVPDPAVVAASARVTGALGRMLVVSNIQVAGAGGRYVGTLRATREVYDPAAPSEGMFTTMRAEIDAAYDVELDDYRFTGVAVIESFRAVGSGTVCSAENVEVPLEGFLYLRDEGTYGFSFGGEVSAEAACDDGSSLEFSMHPLAHHTGDAGACGGDAPLRFEDPGILAGSYEHECAVGLSERRSATWSFTRR